MTTYKRILLAVDLRVTHDVYTISRAIDLAKESKASLNIIHVMEPIYAYGSVQGQTMVDLEKKIAEDARKAFQDLASGYDISADKLLLEIGAPKTVIVEVAKKLNVDLIIVGAHSKHGLQALLGSTADGVISQAHCDVLTVRTVE
ncbi:MAG: universal stress protein [Gammaproteobacteria bacterium]|jgi:universal stress protein A|nr:universal stress protein [Gammaproteobacteria bacterium]